jgi:hypothetical protein
MRWVKLDDCVWISEREVNQEKSRIRELDGVFYACGENHGVLIQQQFSTLKEAKKWVRDETGWSGNP